MKKAILEFLGFIGAGYAVCWIAAIFRDWFTDHFALGVALMLIALIGGVFFTEYRLEWLTEKEYQERRKKN